jgi:hypothetical protein
VKTLDISVQSVAPRMPLRCPVDASDALQTP